jgi:hypothetical protein
MRNIVRCSAHSKRSANETLLCLWSISVSSAVAILRSTPNFFAGVLALGRILRIVSEAVAEGKAMREQYRRQYPSLDW